MDPAFLIKLQRLRDLWGKPLSVTSGVRCRHHNADVGGSPVSQHLLGKAADLRIDSTRDGETLQELAIKAGMGGIGLYASWIHVDDGPQGRRWTS
jgi:zinc D-Ala-D-Ala carboxypeptidase